MRQPEEYFPTKVRPLVQMVARMVQNNPKVADNMDLLWAQIQASAEEFKDPSKCEGCGRSMKVSIYEADLLDALLILKMAQSVRNAMKEGKTFHRSKQSTHPDIRSNTGHFEASDEV